MAIARVTQSPVKPTKPLFARPPSSQRNFPILGIFDHPFALMLTAKQYHQKMINWQVVSW
jgi:hypothetical protein